MSYDYLRRRRGEYRTVAATNAKTENRTPSQTVGPSERLKGFTLRTSAGLRENRTFVVGRRFGSPFGRRRRVSWSESDDLTEDEGWEEETNFYQGVCRCEDYLQGRRGADYDPTSATYAGDLINLVHLTFRDQQLEADYQIHRRQHIK